VNVPIPQVNRRRTSDDECRIPWITAFVLSTTTPIYHQN
jgi:hypothetical protein